MPGSKNTASTPIGTKSTPRPAPSFLLTTKQHREQAEKLRELAREHPEREKILKLARGHEALANARDRLYASSI